MKVGHFARKRLQNQIHHQGFIQLLKLTANVIYLKDVIKFSDAMSFHEMSGLLSVKYINLVKDVVRKRKDRHLCRNDHVFKTISGILDIPPKGNRKRR